MSPEFPQQLSVSDLDLAVSQRQAFGVSYEKAPNSEARLKAYWAGKLILPPQPTWEGDPTDWTANPYNDNNWRFQHHTLRWLNPLRWAALEGDAEAQNEWIRIVRSWAEANVPAEKSGSDFAWRDMADGNRAIQLSLGAPLVSSDSDWFVKLLEYHRDWLMDPKHIVGKNHGLHQHNGLLVLGAVLNDREAVNTAVARMRNQFETTFDRQGTNDEGSSVYHQLNTIWWSQAWQRVRAEGLIPPADVEERLAAAKNVIANIAMPNGELPQIGDASRGNVRTGLSEETDFVASSGLHGTPPRQKALILDRGYIVSRSGWGLAREFPQESHTLIRYGRELRAHSHFDRGSVHIYSAGQPWLIDSGFHSYQRDIPENTYLKSRQAHNLVSILGRNHANNKNVDLIDSHISDELHDFTLLDRGYTNDKLYRRILYFVEADCWIVSDFAESEAAIQISQNWHVEPGTRARLLDNGFRLDGVSSSFGMYWLGRGMNLSHKVAREGTLDGWIGTRWRKLEPGTRLTATSREGSPHLVTLLGAHRKEPLSIVESRISMNRNILAHVARGHKHWRITINDKGVYITPGDSN